MLRQTQLILWRLAAAVALVVGAIGVVVPVLPTVPFLIVAAWAASKSSPALERWLIEHRTYGPHIRRWREHGAVPRNAKLLATGMMMASAIGIQFMSLARWAQIAVPCVMLLVAIWLWMRPEKSPCHSPDPNT